MRFKTNHTTEQTPNRSRTTEGAMYTEIKSSNADAGGIKCILDRTQEDVDRIKELRAKFLAPEITEEEYTEYLKQMKGALNYSDLERIEYNLDLVANMFSAEVDGFDVVLEDMSRDYIPRIPYFQVLLRNVKKLRDTLYILSTTPQVPALPLSWYYNWNDIEQIIYDVYWMKRRFERSFYYCGEELYAGGDYLI